MDASTKRLNEMNRLADMGRFPAVVNAGATVNVLVTLVLTWFVVPRYPQPYAPVLWVALILALNLLPVLLLRSALRRDTEYPAIEHMQFFTDQHKFSDWVYVAASANMAFWVLSGWAIFSISHTPLTLACSLAVAALATFSPVLLRIKTRT